MEDWARNTSGQVYLRINSTKLLKKSEVKNREIQENYDSLSFFTRVQSESKIKMIDMELLEFLKFARNQTMVKCR